MTMLLTATRTGLRENHSKGNNELYAESVGSIRIEYHLSATGLRREYAIVIFDENGGYCRYSGVSDERRKRLYNTLVQNLTVYHVMVKLTMRVPWARKDYMEYNSIS
jgi:hypothetical protein